MVALKKISPYILCKDKVIGIFNLNVNFVMSIISFFFLLPKTLIKTCKQVCQCLRQYVRQFAQA